MNSPIHICHIISDGNVGGAGILLCNLLENIDSERFSSTVILPRSSLLAERLRPKHANIIQAPIPPDSSIAIGGFFVLRSLLSELRPHIVHTHGCAVGRLAARSLGITAVNTRHCDTKMKTTLYKIITDFTVATSESMLKKMRFIPTENRLFIPNGATPPKSLNANQRLQIRNAPKIPESAIVIGSVGRLEKIKGMDILITAASLLRKQKGDCRFVIVGEGSERKALAELVRSRGLEQYVIFCGYRENAGDYMNIFDIGVCASRGSETCPLAVSEMMALSLPVVASDIAGNGYMLKGGAGMLFQNENPKSLCDALFSLCHDKEKRKEIGKKAKARYEKEFSPDLMARRYEALYSSLSHRLGHS